MDWERQIALAERPYGLGLVPVRDIFEYIDARNEEATLTRWQPVLQSLGIEILGIRDVPDGSTRMTVDGVAWELRRMGAGTYEVPPSVYHRIRAAEARDVPFAYYLWGEEQFDHPTFTPEYEAAPPERIHRSWHERFAEALVDPILIAVIPTGPNRGVWCKLGAWFH